MDNNQFKNTEPQFVSFQPFEDSVPIHDSMNTNQSQIPVGSSTYPAFNNLSHDTTGIGILEDLQDMPMPNEDTTPPSFWSIKYYQKFFNVNTIDVIERIKWSMIPRMQNDYFKSNIRLNPDLYGPFWISMTLVLCTAISSNFAHYLDHANDPNSHWKYNFHVVSKAATLICLYVCLVPFLLWCAMKCSITEEESEERIQPSVIPGLLELICLYGYSLAVYIPVALLSTIQNDWWQWTLVILATCLSGGVVLKSLITVFSSGKHKIIYIVAVLGIHLLLGAGFILYFNHVSNTKMISEPLKVTTPTVITGNSQNNTHVNISSPS